MRVVQQYDLTTAAGMDKFAQEIILQRTPARMDADLDAMNMEDAREVRKADTKHCVDFWSALPAAHGGVQSRFNHFYGSMAFGFVHLAAADSKWREVPEQVGRASHKRAVLAPVVVSAMFRTKLLGDATMEQINRLYALTCVASSFSWSDPRDTTRGGVRLAPHAKSSMGGARMRNTKARGSVDGLVRTETILMKRLQSRQRTSFNAAETSVPKILHQMLCLL